MPKKGCSAFFLFCLDLEFIKNVKVLVSVSAWKVGLFYFLQITQDLNTRKSNEHSFEDIGKSETCEKFQQKILNSMVVRFSQSFQFSRQNTLFLKNSEVLSKFFREILHCLISIIKLIVKVQSVFKTEFYINHESYHKTIHLQLWVSFPQQLFLQMAEVYPGFLQASKMESFVKIVKSFSR